MKKILSILLLLVSLVSFSQEYYRDTTIERAVVNEVNRHRDSMGLHTVRFNPDNIRAVEWGEVLVKHDLSTDKYHCSCCRGVLYHCNCAPGVEIIALRVIGDENEITMSVEETAKKLVKGWDGSPSHKKGMEDINMTRGFNSVYVFKSEFYNGKYVALSVYQFLKDKEYYIEKDWDENWKYGNRFLTPKQKEKQAKENKMK